MTDKAVGVMEGIKDITECCICTEIFTDPRMLPCIHTFCLTCLEKTGSQLEKKPGDNMPCPLCRKEFTIPTNGFLGIQKHFFMERLIELAKLSKPPEVIRFCDSCKVNESKANVEPPLAKMYCIECEENLCDDCILYHKRQKLLKCHQIVAFGNQAMNENLIKRTASSSCDKHKNQPIEMYCDDCSKAICMKCFALAHKGHNCSDVEDVVEKFRKQIESIIDKANISYADGLKIKTQLDVEKTNFIQQVETAETRIVKTSNELKELVDKHTQSLLAQLAAMKAETLKTLEIQREEIDMHLRLLETFKTYCREMKTKGTPGDICRTVDDLCIQSSELEQTHKSLTEQPISSIPVTFEKTELEILLSERNMVGTLEGTGEAGVIKNSNPVVAPFSINFSTEIEEWFSAIGLAHLTFRLTRLGHKIYVMHRTPDRILVYHQNRPFSVLEEFIVKDLKSPCDMAACATTNCLYVADSESKCIWKIEPSDHRVTRWLSNVGDPYNLSVSNDGRVVIPRHGQPSVVEIYGPDAVLIQSVKLPDEIEQPKEAVETPTGNIVILHRLSDASSVVLSEVTKTGQVVHRFTPDDEAKILNDGCRFVIFAKDGQFLVSAVDSDNSRIVVFDAELKKFYELISLLRGGSDEEDKTDADDDPITAKKDLKISK